MPYPRLRLRRREEIRLTHGHVWVYSNEIDNKATPLRHIQSDLVIVEDYRGKPLGTASFCAHALICARVLSRSVITLDLEWIVSRIKTALQLRELYFTEPYYRLVYGESDALPGVVIDRFAHVFVIQLSTTAMDQRQALFVDALTDLFGKDTHIIFKHDGKGRQIENLPTELKQIGSSDIQSFEVIENNTSFLTPITGQKTGWFYDHRLGRAWLNNICTGKSVLDLFSYVGGWGIQAAAHGASEVTCVDISEEAGEWVVKNAQRNNLKEVSFHEANVFDYLKEAAKDPDAKRYDVVVLDPPALIQKRKDFEQGRQAYFSVNEHALARVAMGGIFVSASCSLHFNRDTHCKMIEQISKRLSLTLQLIFEPSHSLDHPRLTAVPETAYLTCMMFRVLPQQ